jgi:hypothetical protein
MEHHADTQPKTDREAIDNLNRASNALRPNRTPAWRKPKNCKVVSGGWLKDSRGNYREPTGGS